MKTGTGRHKTIWPKPKAGTFITTDSTFWIVTDPTPDSELADIFGRCTLHGLNMQFLGGLKAKEENLTIYTDETAAKADALERLAKWTH